jgi:hypothetical protein
MSRTPLFFVSVRTPSQNGAPSVSLLQMLSTCSIPLRHTPSTTLTALQRRSPLSRGDEHPVQIQDRRDLRHRRARPGSHLLDDSTRGRPHQLGRYVRAEVLAQVRADLACRDRACQQRDDRVVDVVDPLPPPTHERGFDAPNAVMRRIDLQLALGVDGHHQSVAVA